MAAIILSSYPAVGSVPVPRAIGPSTLLPYQSSLSVGPGSNFSTYLGNIERTSSSLSKGPINLTTAPSLHLLWSYDAGSLSVQSQPVEQNGIVYFGGNSGYEYALYATNGTLVWKTFLGLANADTQCGGSEGVTSTATVVGSRLYVDGGYPYLYALNSTTGAVEWRAPIGSGTNAQGFYDWSSPLVFDQHAYVGISSDCDQPLVPAGVDEFSLSTHALVRYFNASVPAPNGSSIWGSPSLNPATHTLFVSTGNPYGETATKYSESVIALNATTLAVKASWQVPAAQATGDGDFGVAPTVFTPAGGFPMVTAADKNGILYAFYQSNLTLAWEARICSTNFDEEHISTAWGEGYVYAVSSATTIGGVSYNGSVRAFNPLTGSIVWAKGLSESPNSGYAAPLWVDGLLIVPDAHTLWVLNAKTGATLYHYHQSGDFVAAASISRGEIFTGSSNGRVYAFGLSSKSVARIYSPIAMPASIAASPGPRIRTPPPGEPRIARGSTDRPVPNGTARDESPGRVRILLTP